MIAFTVLDNKYFEDLQNYNHFSKNKKNAYLNSIARDFDNKWSLNSEGIWTYCVNENNIIPKQGWKIHISATQYNAKKILKKVADICKLKEISFKFAFDSYILSLINSKNWGRGTSGKFITIYPTTLEEFEIIIEKLYKELKRFKGPYILSDFRYKKSNVIFFRYGGFQAITKINIFGEKEFYIRDGKGKEILDNRPVYPIIPKSVKLPLYLQEMLRKARSNRDEKEIKLNNRYIIKNAISHKNSGGVYKAIDTKTNKLVIIKEARPFTGIYKNRIDSVYLLKKEKMILDLLKDKRVTPAPIEFFKEWENYFLVQEYLKGVTLTKYRSLYKYNIMMSDIRSFSNQEKNHFNKEFLEITLNLLKSVEIIHNHGIIIGDLSPNNIMIDLKSKEIRFIDLEGAYIIGEKKWLNLYTPGFASKNKQNNGKPRFADDYYSLGSLLFGLVFFVNNNIYNFDSKKSILFLKKLLCEGYINHYIYSLIMNLKKENKCDKDLVKREIGNIEHIIEEENTLKPNNLIVRGDNEL